MLKSFLIFITAICLVGCTGEILAPVAAGSWFNFDRRTAKTLVNDQSITVKANLAIAKNIDIWKSSHISTLSYNGSILLVGQTPNQYYKADVEKMVEKIGGVSTIYNQITIGQPICLSERTRDTCITADVKSRIIGDRNVGINRVKVITEAGVVYLMGSLTEDEEKTAIEIARRVPCVKKVVTAVERENDLEGYEAELKPDSSCAPEPVCKPCATK